MRLKQLTDSEKQWLRNSAKVELQRMENVLLDENTVQLIDEFKNRYNICETVYKILLAEYYKAKGEKPKGYLQVDMVQAPAALKFAGYTFDKESLNELFGSKSKKGKTVKKLRDATTHGIDKKAVKEILARKEELLNLVDDGKIALRPAVELSYLTEKEQNNLFETISFADATPSLAQAIKMRSFSKEGKLSKEVIESIISEEKPNQKEKISFRIDKLRKHIPATVPMRQTEEYVLKALEYYTRYRENMRSSRDR